MSKKPDRKIGAQTERIAGDYLFKVDPDESKSLDMRTRIKSEATFNALIFYGILSEGLESKAAKKIKDMLERMLIARDGKGREEAVDILRQSFPRVREVDRGSDLQDYVDRASKTVE